MKTLPIPSSHLAATAAAILLFSACGARWSITATPSTWGMRTYVAVMSHPFFSVTGESGELRIDGLQAGTSELAAWHEKLGVQSARVTVGDGETATADFSFSVPSGG